MFPLGESEGIDENNLVKKGKSYKVQFGKILEGSEKAILEIFRNLSNFAYFGEIRGCLRKLRLGIQLIQIHLSHVYRFHSKVIYCI